MKVLICFIFLYLVSAVYCITVTIPPGANSKWIANHLYNENVINNPTAFYAYIRLKNLSSSLHSGTFDIPQGASYSKITNILSGKVIQTISVTIPEGYTLSEIADTLAKKEIINNPTEFLHFVKFKAKKSFINYDFISVNFW